MYKFEMKKIIFLSVVLFMGLYVLHLSFERPHRVPFIWRVPYTMAECGGVNFNKEVLKGLNDIRLKTKKRFYIFSAYRDSKSNKEVGGVANSQHLRGNAVDLWIPMQYRSEFYDAAKLAGFKGFGWGNRSVHIDFGKKRWWTYNDKGKAVGGYEKFKFLHKAPKNFRNELK